MIKIPQESLKAAQSAYTARIYKGTGSLEEFAAAIEDACNAMIEAWPGMLPVLGDEEFPRKIVPHDAIILPLTEGDGQ